jgi:hypothetical protein
MPKPRVSVLHPALVPLNLLHSRERPAVQGSCFAKAATPDRNGGRSSCASEDTSRVAKALRNRGPIISRQPTILHTSHIQLLTHLDCLRIKTQSLLLISKEVLYVLALVALELDYLAHLGVGDDSAIAGKLLLDHLEDLLLVEFFGQSLDCG